MAAAPQTRRRVFPFHKITNWRTRKAHHVVGSSRILRGDTVKLLFAAMQVLQPDNHS